AADEAQLSYLSQVYLVTGGCGFIGEKIVELLSQQDYIKEVRVFDSGAREEEKIIPATTHVTVMKGDIRDYNLLLAAMRGVHVVIHTAAIVDYRNTVPFWEMKAVNVGGQGLQTKSRYDKRLPAPSSTSTVTQHLAIYSRGNEDTKYSGEVELPYGKTKAMAEKLVFEANGKKVQKSMVAPLVLQHRMRNVAWMHVLAARHLQLRPDLLAGQVYYYIRSCLLWTPSIRLGSHIPYWKMWLIIHLRRIIKVLLYPFWKPQPFLNLPLLNTIVTTFSYETDKAFRHFGYKPLFTWQESKQRTAQWLKAAAGNLSCPHLHEKEN
uniref:3-beta hydroxysteroid dehydrogenase/isomerase domain-containing protein n=1 Tax=Anas platyrhynchos TaxID=8839 RepID=A0A8B9ZBK5_ANAPL